MDVQPVHIEGRSIARSFWGRRWCHHLESCSDFENRLPRGRAYVRNGSVCHLDVHAGGVDAMVVGSDLYHVVVRIRKLEQVAWKAIRAECAGRVGSVLELLQGRLSDHVLRVVTDPDRGLFPKPREITLTCDCPDWAVMCKHAAAVLYGVGSRLDNRPELLFRLRDVDVEDLVVGDMALPDASAGGRRPRRRSRGHLRHRSRPGGQRRGGRSAADHRTPPAPPREAPWQTRRPPPTGVFCIAVRAAPLIAARRCLTVGTDPGCVRMQVATWSGDTDNPVATAPSTSRRQASAASTNWNGSWRKCAASLRVCLPSSQAGRLHEPPRLRLPGHSGGHCHPANAASRPLTLARPAASGKNSAEHAFRKSSSVIEAARLPPRRSSSVSEFNSLGDAETVERAPTPGARSRTPGQGVGLTFRAAYDEFVEYVRAPSAVQLQSERRRAGLRPLGNGLQAHRHRQTEPRAGRQPPPPVRSPATSLPRTFATQCPTSRRISTEPQPRFSSGRNRRAN